MQMYDPVSEGKNKLNERKPCQLTQGAGDRCTLMPLVFQFVTSAALRKNTSLITKLPYYAKIRRI